MLKGQTILKDTFFKEIMHTRKIEKTRYDPNTILFSLKQYISDKI